MNIDVRPWIGSGHCTLITGIADIQISNETCDGRNGIDNVPGFLARPQVAFAQFRDQRSLDHRPTLHAAAGAGWMSFTLSGLIIWNRQKLLECSLSDFLDTFCKELSASLLAYITVKTYQATYPAECTHHPPVPLAWIRHFNTKVFANPRKISTEPNAQAMYALRLVSPAYNGKLVSLNLEHQPCTTNLVR